MKGITKFAYLIIVLIALAALFAVLTIESGIVLASVNQSTINVSVTDLTTITILPNYLNFSGPPGSQATEPTSYWNLTLRNSGSNNLTTVYANISTPDDESVNPLTDLTKYVSGGFLVLKNESDTSYTYAGRLEWNVTEDIGQALYSVDADGVTRRHQGWYRNASGNYLWELGNGTDGPDPAAETFFCNLTGAVLEIEADVDVGTAGTRTPAVSGGTVSAQTDWGIFTFSSGPLNGMCVAAYYDCSKIYIYKYTMYAPFTSCTNAANLYADIIIPGNSTTIYAQAFISEGVPDGDLTTSTLTIIAS